jgi:hypothetical protein
MPQPSDNHAPAIDFLIIGAQKAGTTSLFEYLRRHPQIHMPAEKEISFFNNNHRRGWDWYVATALRDAPPNAVCGEASIGYMCGTPYTDIATNEQGYRPPAQELDRSLETIIPERIKEAVPGVKLICVLRDPVARAYSHYQMAVLEKAELRTFDDAIDASLNPAALTQARIAPTTTNGYIVNGEYGRILAGFMEIFPREQLLIVFSDELSEHPVSTLSRIFDFVGVDPNCVPDNLNTRYRAAATKQRVPGLNLHAWQERVAKLRLLRSLWHALPDRLRAGIDRAYRLAGFRVTMWNAHRGETEPDAIDSVHDRLIEHFLPDSRALSRLIGLDAPWLADWRNRSS